MRRARSRRQVVSAVTCAFFVSSFVLTAHAADKRVLRAALLDIQGNSSPESTDIHYFVEKGIRTSGVALELTPLDDVLNAGANATDIQNVAFAKEAATAGRKAFEAGNCEEAADQLGQAVTYYEQSMAFVEDFDDYVNALTLQGVCLARSGAKKAAIQVLEKAFVVEYKLDFARFPNEKGVFEAARNAVRDRQIGSITVITTPTASRVFVNGGYRGVSTVFRPGLRRGVHFVRVERQGFGRVGERVDTRKGKADRKVDLTITAARKKPALTSLLAGLQKEFRLPEAGEATSRLQGLLLVDYVVLFKASGAPNARKVELALYDLVSGRRLNEVEGTVDWAARDRQAKRAVMELAKTLVSVELQQKVTIKTPTPPVGGGTTPSEGGIHTKWWFWTAIGAVALGTTLGLVFGLQPEDEKTGLDADGNGALLIRF